jgi:hypothetical protein
MWNELGRLVSLAHVILQQKFIVSSITPCLLDRSVAADGAGILLGKSWLTLHSHPNLIDLSNTHTGISITLFAQLPLLDTGVWVLACPFHLGYGKFFESGFP